VSDKVFLFMVPAINVASIVMTLDVFVLLVGPVMFDTDFNGIIVIKTTAENKIREIDVAVGMLQIIPFPPNLRSNNNTTIHHLFL
jgi:hypothetical protein